MRDLADVAAEVVPLPVIAARMERALAVG